MATGLTYFTKTNKQNSLDKLRGKYPFNIAVTGNSGTGKSSYINAIRGLWSDDERAAAVGVTETTMSPTPYSHPTNEKLIFWDLPGVGARNFKRESYLDKVDFHKYVVFCILCSKRLTENDLWLVETLREQNKMYYCVRTCIDNDLKTERKSHPRTFNRERTLDVIRDDLVQQLGSNTEVFLIDSYNTSEYDFGRLSDRLSFDTLACRPYRSLDDALACKEVPSASTSPLTDGVMLQNETQELKRINIGTGPSICEISEDEKVLLKQRFMKDGVDGIKHFMEKRMNEWKTIPLNIAVTGNSGTGKSSYINAIRGLTADDDGAAAVGVNETTTSPTPYPNPKNKNLIFWDLPGVGTTNYKRDTYLEQVDFQIYDFFFIMCSKRFTDNDLWLVQTVREQEKRFYCVRTCMDNDLENEKKSHPKTFNKETTLAVIRANLVQQLKSNTDVFLIDSYNTSKYDFDRLTDRLLSDASDLKKEAMILAFSPLTDAVILQKRDRILKRVSRISSLYQVAVGLLNAPINVIGFSGLHSLKLVENLVIKRIVSEANIFHEQFGSTDSDLKTYADLLNISVEKLRLKWKIHNFQPTFLKSDLERAVAGSQNTVVFFPILNLFANVFVSDDVQILLKGFETVLNEMIEDAKKVIHEKSKLLIT